LARCASPAQRHARATALRRAAVG